MYQFEITYYDKELNKTFNDEGIVAGVNLQDAMQNLLDFYTHSDITITCVESFYEFDKKVYIGNSKGRTGG